MTIGMNISKPFKKQNNDPFVLLSNCIFSLDQFRRDGLALDSLAKPIGNDAFLIALGKYCALKIYLHGWISDPAWLEKLCRICRKIVEIQPKKVGEIKPHHLQYIASFSSWIKVASSSCYLFDDVFMNEKCWIDNNKKVSKCAWKGFTLNNIM